MNHTIVLTSGSLADWNVVDNGGTDTGMLTGTCSDMAAGLAVQDVVLHTGGGDKTDGVDNAFTVWVGGAQFVAPDTVDLTDHALTAGPVTMSSLDVTVEYRALQASPLLRVLVTLHNPTAMAIQTPVDVATNFGSDSSTGKRGMSSSQNWVVTSDHAVDPPSDPAILMVAAGPPDRGFAGYTQHEQETFTCHGTEGSDLDPVMIVPAGETISLMEFIGLGATNAEAIAAGATFDTTPAADDDLLAGIAPNDLFSIVNWNFFGNTELTGFDDSEWTITAFRGTSNRQATDGSCGPIPGIAVQDAKVGNASDAFDGGLELFVDDQQIVPPVATTPSDHGVAFGPATLSNLDVTLAYEALQDSPTLRTLVTLRNPTAAAIATTVRMASNFGSDADTAIAATSSGDTALGTDDHWSISADSLTMPSDAVNTSVFAGPGSPPSPPTQVADTVFTCAEPNGLVSSFALTIGPGETQSLLFFNQLHASIASATNDVPTFNQEVLPSSPTVAGLDSVALSSVVNWTACRIASYDAVSCRLDGVTADVTSNGTAGKPLDKLLARLAAAKTNIGKAGAAADVGKKGAAKRGLKAVAGALKAFEKMLKGKKLQTVLGEGVRTRLGATSADIRTTLKQLPLAI